MQIESRHAEVTRMNWQLADDVDLSSRMQSVAERFEHISVLADVWRCELLAALVQCQDFHRTIDNLHDWLNHIEVELNAVEPIDLRGCKSELRRKHSKLKVFMKCCVYVLVIVVLFTLSRMSFLLLSLKCSDYSNVILTVLQGHCHTSTVINTSETLMLRDVRDIVQSWHGDVMVVL